MRRLNWLNRLPRAFAYLLVIALLDAFFGTMPWLLLAATFGYLSWSLWQLRSIYEWLLEDGDRPPPESRGVWGDVFDGIYRLQRRSQEERERLQAAVDYLQDSFASLSDAAVMVDKWGNIEWSNQAAEKLLGLRYPDDVRQQLVNLVRAPAFIEYFEARNYRESFRMPSPQSSHIQLLIQVTFFGRGSRLLFARDITQTHRLLEMRKDFVGNVSHELRTPLTVITGYLETLAENPINDELRLRRVIDQMLAQARRMENLLRDLILLSRLETVPEAVEQNRIEVRKLLDTIRNDVLAACNQEREISIECDPTLSLVGNLEELRSAFANLVMNAAKYTNKGGRIQVRWFADKTHAYLEVRDNGIGIEEHHLPRLTERFYRVDTSRSINTGGTGLGLAIVKHILLRHQAELRITSVPGQGSVFTCVFPLLRTIAQSHSA